MKGTVKWYRKEKGYGFITGEDEKDYFIHYTSLPQGTDDIDGKDVEFEVKETERGVQAVDIKFDGSKLSDGASDDYNEEAKEAA